MITLKITRTKENENYEEEIEEWREKIRFANIGSSEDYPKHIVIEKTLEVEITEEQFEAIRKAALTNF